MSKEKQDPEFDAHQMIYTALKGFDAQQQRKILKSVVALLEIDSSPDPPQPVTGSELQTVVPAKTVSAARSHSLVELLNKKSPGVNSQMIVLFAYYREKYELNRRFSRDDLEGYFSKARLSPSTNYDRDFVEAVKKGWIHEDGSDSYITSKGIEAVEANFAGERKHLRKKLTASKKTARKKNSHR